MEINDITQNIIGAAIEVHRNLGPGLLESTYETCLSKELELRQISYVKQMPLPINYKGLTLDCGYRVDLLVENLVVVEIKSIEAILPIHEAQLLTYMKLGKWPIGLLLNFNVSVLRQGIRRMILDNKSSHRKTP
jgi:GxxExxY protein